MQNTPPTKLPVATTTEAQQHLISASQHLGAAATHLERQFGKGSPEAEAALTAYDAVNALLP